jgi:hypothetical protein
MAQEHRIIRRGITSRPLVYRIPAGTGAPPSMIKPLVSLQRHQKFDHQIRPRGLTDRPGLLGPEWLM